jgi:predicted nucleic-acid-binding protein
MIGLDTNVIVRYIMQDEPRQAAKATTLIEGLSDQMPGFVPLLSVVELVWVLSSSYQLDRAQITQALDVLLRSRQLRVDQAEHVARALRSYGAGTADFADCLIERTASAAGCSRTMTFDAAAAQSARMTLIR